MIKENNYDFNDEKIGIVFPIYSLGVPNYIENFLNKVTLNSKYIFAIMTYGMYAGSASMHLQKIAARNKIKFSYINEILMVDNYIPVYSMEKQLKTESEKDIDKQINKV